MGNQIKLWIYPGANPNAVSSSLWAPYEVDISQYVRRPGSDGGAPITYSWGKQDESTQTDASSMTLTLDDRDGRFSTDNIMGPYYGQIDTNTPIRMGVLTGTDPFTRTLSALGPAAGWGTINAALGQAWISSTGVAGSTTYAVDGSKGTVNVTGGGVSSNAIADGFQCRDVDIITTVYPIAAATGASYGGGHLIRWTDNNNLYATSIEFNTAGDVTAKIRKTTAGVTSEIGAVNPIPSTSYSAGVAWKIRTQVEGPTIRVKVWPAASAEPTSWRISIEDSDQGGTGLGIWSDRFVGNTNTGAFIGYDDFTVTALEYVGYVISWPDEWDQTGNNCWARITAAGSLRRLRQGTNPIVSPLTRQLSNTADAVSYWPMEEGSDAAFFANKTAAGRPGTFSDVSPASETSLAGGGQAPSLASDQGVIRLPVTPGVNSGGTGFSAMVFFKLSSLPAAKTRIITVSPRSGPVATYAFSVDAAGNTILEALNADASVIVSATNGTGVDLTEWTAWQIETDNTAGGGNTSVAGTYHQVGAVDYFSQLLTVSGTTLSNIGGMTLTGGSSTAFAHAWLGRNTLPFVTNTFSRVSSGYVGELAAKRFARVCGEVGITYSIRGGTGISSQAMGPQREAKTLDVLQACIDADYAVMAEQSSGLEFIPKAVRWNAASVGTLSKVAGEIGAVPKPIRDDQRLKNRITASRVNGSSAIYQNDASVLRNGPWEDSVTLNLIDDSTLDSQASWRVYIGTASRRRWPSVVMNFARAPQLMKLWRARQYGFRFGVITGLVQSSGNEPDLIMEGFQATLDPDVWEVEMNCTDAATWAVGVWDTNLWGAVYTTLGADITTTGTTIILSSSNVFEQWKAGVSTAHIMINGTEEVALGTIGAVTGSGPWTQTVTGCTRSVNGVVKAHVATEPITVKNALRWTL